MVNDYNKLPEPLKKLLLIRVAFAALSLILGVCLIITTRDPYVYMPGIGVFVFFVFAVLSLFRRAVSGRYVVVSGECIDVVRSTVRKQMKSIIISSGESEICVVLRNRSRNILPGAHIDVYLSDKTPVYEKDGVKTVYSYLAINV
jgi:hypothetical protein